MTKFDLPRIYEFLDYRLFLRSWFDAKQKGNPRFSHRLFARLAKQSSPSFLSQVIKGDRNLTPRNVELFVVALGLRKPEGRFFSDLVRFDQASTENEREAAWACLSASKRFKEARSLEGKGFEYISHWYYPAVRELASCSGFRDDPKWIARTLRPAISVAQARRSLEFLFELKLLVRTEDGGIEPLDTTVVTPREVAGMAAHNYHRGMLQLAEQSITSAAPAERHLCAATVSVPEELVAELKEELSAFQERILDLCDRAEQPSTRVYQCNLTLFPLSASTKEEVR